jgi:transcription elongation factor GreA
VVEEIKRRLDEEMRTLEHELKVTLPKEILRAREHGDLRENAEFKGRQGAPELPAGAHRTVASPHGGAADGQPVQDPQGQGRPRLQHRPEGHEDREKVHYEIVTPEESDPPSGRISPSFRRSAPALLNHEVGDEVEIRVPSGTRELEIIKLVTIHDHSDE